MIEALTDLTGTMSPTIPTVTIFGLVVGADNALLSHEADKRVSEAALRREARLDLARRGIVGTETEIAKWKDERAKNTNPLNTPPAQ